MSYDDKGAEEGAVMYVGPDSLALVEHLTKSCLSNLPSATVTTVVDFCCGCGIQALSTLSCLSSSQRMTTQTKAYCIDINLRALRFTKFNALLNGLEDHVEVVQCDLTSDASKRSLVQELKRTNRLAEHAGDEIPSLIVLANPPFLPVPACSDDISKRYGLFSSGGMSGEVILKEIIILAGELFSKSNGILGIVSEFMNPGDELCQRILNWWGSSDDTLTNYESDRTAMPSHTNGCLFTNQNALPSSTYAMRRADNEAEFEVWKNHLITENIGSVSPGLLFLQTDRKDHHEGQNSKLGHVIVPKSELGSIWTPGNKFGLNHIHRVWGDIVRD